MVSHKKDKNQIYITLTDIDYADNLALLTYALAQALLHSCEQAAERMSLFR